jgi:hypothetical protein
MASRAVPAEKKVVERRDSNPRPPGVTGRCSNQLNYAQVVMNALWPLLVQQPLRMCESRRELPVAKGVLCGDLPPISVQGIIRQVS